MANGRFQMGSMPVHGEQLAGIAANNAAAGRNASDPVSLPEAFKGDYGRDDMLQTLLQWLYTRIDATR